MDSIVLFIIVAFIAFLFLKYFSADSPPPGTDSEYTWVSRNIDQVLVMFPNTDTNAIAYDLSKTRSVEETIEKLLAGQDLPSPPITSRFHDFANRSDTNTSSAASTSSSNSRANTRNGTNTNEPTKEDLIKKYNLQNRVYADPLTSEPDGSQKYEWSKSREEREKTLRRRKEEMVLAARRKLQAKETQKA